MMEALDTMENIEKENKIKLIDFQGRRKLIIIYNDIVLYTIKSNQFDHGFEQKSFREYS